MSGPARLQLSRRKGFNLQEISRAANGLEAASVTRSGVFGGIDSVEKFGMSPAPEPVSSPCMERS